MLYFFKSEKNFSRLPSDSLDLRKQGRHIMVDFFGQDYVVKTVRPPRTARGWQSYGELEWWEEQSDVRETRASGGGERAQDSPVVHPNPPPSPPLLHPKQSCLSALLFVRWKWQHHYDASPLFPTSLGCPRTCSVMILHGAAWRGLGHLCQEYALPHVILCLFRMVPLPILCFLPQSCKETKPVLPVVQWLSICHSSWHGVQSCSVN